MAAIALSDSGSAASTRKLGKSLPWLLLAPSITLLLLLIAFPLFFALYNSFYFWNLQMSPQPMAFIGFGNYEQALGSSTFMLALRNTLLLSIGGTAIQFALGLAIAVLLTQTLRGVTLVRVLLIMPTTIAPIVVGFLFRYMYDANGGLLPWVLQVLFIPLPAEGLLGSSTTALMSIMFADVWQWTPFFAIVLYAGLLSVPDALVEAARVDGASRWTILTRIKLPVIKRTVLIILMLRFMQLFNTFDLVLILTRGGPGASSRTLSYSLYQQGLIDFNIGVASAMTWIIVLILNVILAIYIYIAFRDWEW